MAPISPEQVIHGVSAGASLDAPDHVLTWNVNAKTKTLKDGYLTLTSRHVVSFLYVVSSETNGPRGTRVEF